VSTVCASTSTSIANLCALSKRSWTLGELFDLFPELRVPSDVARRCVEPLRGHGRFLREKAGERNFAEVSLHVTPALEFSVVVGNASVGAGTANEDVIVRAVLQGILSGAIRNQPPAWACRVECMEAIANPISAVSMSVAASLAMQDALAKPGWDPPDPMLDSAQAAKIA